MLFLLFTLFRFDFLRFLISTLQTKPACNVVHRSRIIFLPSFLFHYRVFFFLFNLFLIVQTFSSFSIKPTLCLYNIFLFYFHFCLFAFELQHFNVANFYVGRLKWKAAFLCLLHSKHVRGDHLTKTISK